jgi:dTDP-4-dehydrorhamnose 3,5-epimerase
MSERVFVEADIDGVVLRELPSHVDQRGWLCELYRTDELDPDSHPTMAYVSATHPGIARGPHEHVEQSDVFCFIGPSDFLLLLWDNRPESPTYNHHMRLTFGQAKPMLVVIPPGIVHGYLNVGDTMGIVMNLPNRLYRGEGRTEAVDEIRHEEDADSIYKMA